MMGDECYYYSSPPELEGCGICQDCLENEAVVFFCSRECYAYNSVRLYLGNFLGQILIL